MNHDLLPLELLDRDTLADVAEVEGDHSWVNRLAELGLRIGPRLRVVQPGSPCLVQVGDARLSLRGDWAMQILVRPCATCRDHPMPTLDQLPSRQRARVEALQGDDALAQRLMEMGLLEGEEVEVVGFAPLGDPMEIRLRDYRLSLRRSEAARIQVAILP